MKYNKNYNYSSQRIASDIMAECPGYFKDMRSAINSINYYISCQNFKPTNEQKHSRVYSGVIAQRIFDHFKEEYYKKQKKELKSKQIKVEDVITEKTSVIYRKISVTFMSRNGEKLDRFSKELNIPKVKILDAFLTAFFEIYPEMSPEELHRFIENPSFVETHQDNKEQSDDSNGVISRLDTIVDLLDQINKYLT